MVQNIAVLIGAPNSGSSDFAPLPACENDVIQMADLISATKRFGRIEKHVDKTSSETLDFLKSLIGQNDKVGDLFLYFTGHGHIDQSDHYWVVNQFDIKNPSSTGISRDSLFSILKSIDATNTILVRDTCFSGQAFYKSSEEDRLPPLSNLVAFSSSAANMKTPSGFILSPYTDHFIEAASFAKERGSVDYLDISQKLKDILSQNSFDTHFGYQGETIVKFCDDANLLAPIRSKYLIEDTIEETAVPDGQLPATEISDEETLKNACDAMLSQEKTQQLIDEAMAFVKDKINAHEKNGQFFTLSSDAHSDFYHATNKQQLYEIFRTLPKWDNFVDASHERKRKRQRSLAFGAVDALFEEMYKPEYENFYKFDLSVSLDHVHQIFHLNPKFGILRRREIEFLYVPGVFKIFVFWRTNQQGLSDWNEYTSKKPNENWAHKELDTSNVHQSLDDILTKFLDASETAVTRTIQNLRAKA